MLTVFLGAGFSYIGGVPLANKLFDYHPEVDRITRQKLVDRVLSDWERWRSDHGGEPEEYLAFVQKNSSRKWIDAVWYVALVIALEMGRVENVGLKRTITRHNINRTTKIEAHEAFWSKIFRNTLDVTVITTNYDILAERGIRHEPRPRVHRPGFHYGKGTENLAGGGYPSYAHIQKISVSGSVPILKLHGSVSWSFQKGKLVFYADCRPAIRGDAAIVAPVTNKKLPTYLTETWKHAEDALSKSKTWFIVGYSLPEYDLLVRQLFEMNSVHQPTIHIFDPNPNIIYRYAKLLPMANLVSHPGLPEALNTLDSILASIKDREGAA